MSELADLLRDTMRDAARQAPPPQGRRPSAHPPRRAKATIAGAALATTVVVGGGAFVLHQSVVRPSSPSLGRPAVASPGTVEVSLSHRLFGFNRVALQIPRNWTLDDYACGKPQSNTIAVRPPMATAACYAARADGVSDIVLDSLSSTTAYEWRHLATQPVTLADGTPAERGDTTMDGYHIAVIMVPRRDAILVGTSPRAGQLDNVLGSITAMPDGFAAVPDVIGMPVRRAVAVLEVAGLKAETRLVQRPSPTRGDVVASRPQPAHVLLKQTAVTLLVGK